MFRGTPSQRGYSPLFGIFARTLWLSVFWLLTACGGYEAAQNPQTQVQRSAEALADSEASEDSLAEQSAPVGFAVVQSLAGQALPTLGENCVIVQTEAGLAISCGEEGGLLRHGKDGLTPLFKLERTYDLEPAICPRASGLLLYVGLDKDRDGILAEEEITQSSLVCDGVEGQRGASGVNGQDGANGRDGVNGKDGLVSLVRLARLETRATLCAAQSGILVQSGLDTNRDHTLSDAEVSEESFLCDGHDGAPGLSPKPCEVKSWGDLAGVEILCDGHSEILYHGRNGTNGKDGASGANSLLLSQRLENTELCSGRGGVLIKTGLDANRNANLELSEVLSQSFLCDGLSGEEGFACKVEAVATLNAVRITCGSTSALVYNGKDGAKGDKGDPGAPAEGCSKNKKCRDQCGKCDQCTKPGHCDKCGKDKCEHCGEKHLCDKPCPKCGSDKKDPPGKDKDDCGP